MASRTSNQAWSKDLGAGTCCGNSRTWSCQCSLFWKKNPFIRSFCKSWWPVFPFNPNKWSFTVPVYFNFLFDVHVIVDRNKFLIIKPTRCTNFSNLFLTWKCTCFRQFLCPLSGDFHCTHSNGICHTVLLTACVQAVSKTVKQIPIAVYTVLDSWWWTEELSETCKFLFHE